MDDVNNARKTRNILAVIFCVTFVLSLIGGKGISNILLVPSLTLGVWCGIYTHFIIPRKLREAVESDDIEVRSEALYQLGNDEWAGATSNNDSMTHEQRKSKKDAAVEYWIQAGKLGHEGAMDKLRMAQIRRG